MSVAQINTKVAEAVTAIEASDWSTALTKLRAAKALLIGMPNSQGTFGERLDWDRQAIDALIREVQGEIAGASGGIQRTKITYVNPTE